MDTDRLIALSRIAFSVALVVLAGAIIFFTLEARQIRQELPALLTQFDTTIERAEPALAELQKVDGLVRDVLTRVDTTHEQIPEILTQVEQTRDAIPPILEEIEAVRESLPAVLETVNAASEGVDGAVAELENYRPLIPLVVDEVANTRQELPDIIERADQLVANAKTAGQEAAEGSVTGLVTGIFKMPFNMISSLGEKAASLDPALTGQLTDDDIEELRASTIKAIEDESQQSWEGASGNRGTVEVVSKRKRGRRTCVTTRHEIYIADRNETEEVVREHCAT